MKVAIVHDWLTGMRGGEKVLECLCELYPGADLYTLVHIEGSCSDIIEGMNIHTSFIDQIPGRKRYYRHMLPLMPFAIERFILKDYDLILSSSHCVAKGIIPGPDSVHISYVHSPMRYVWDMYEDYFGKGRINPIAGGIIPFFATGLRQWDVTSSARVDCFIANSGHVARRINKYYRRDAGVIHPPLDLERFSIKPDRADYFLMLTAFAPYKRVDLAIQAFNAIKKPLKIVGSGQDEKRLKEMAGPTIEFMGWQSDAQIVDLYSRCQAFIFPGEEDFGITPLEAMGSGRPVIAFARGGALETIRGLDHSNPTGVFFAEQGVDSLLGAIHLFEDNCSGFDPEQIRAHAAHWNRDRFKNEIMGAIDTCLAKKGA